MNNTQTPNIVLGFLIAVGALIVVAGIVFFGALGDRPWVHIPVHSAAEVFGGFAAITLSLIITVSRAKARTLGQNAWAAAALLAMGILDVFHGAVDPGDLFIWLHSAATLAGGLAFFMVWIPWQAAGAMPGHVLVWGAGFVAMLIGALSLAFPQSLPAMLVDGEFTPAAKAINILGGALFVAAAPRFLISYRSVRARDDILFFAICILLGSAGLLFSFGRPWGAGWWFWHMLRVSALSMTLIYMVVVFRRTRAIADAIGSIGTSTAELGATTAQHERIAAQQAAMVSETATTLDELAASARQSAEQAESAAGFSQKASTLTEQGGQNVQRAVAAMAGLREQIGAVSSQLLVLGEQSGRIGSIANLVRDIAAQTNMLALNAAVEAARAGEHGKGFAVIAAEVRKLADQSKKSAEQAGELVAAILKATSGSVMTAETGGKTVAEVGQLAEEVGRLFESLSGVATSVLQNAQQVLLNVKQQTGALDQLKQAVSTIDAGARETAAGLGQTRAAIQKMNDAAQGLQEMV